jgi:molybdopterin/thiamine biosynthesis adenylyltransferase/rhodanese-related sulfurtransferase
MGSAAETMTNEQRIRYSRHLIMPEVGADGQQRLNAASVLCIGAGGLGSPAALYLAAAGIGTLGIVDFDQVDLTNLQRQILHGTADVGRKKVDSARDRLRDVNPTITVETHDHRLTSGNAPDLIERYDVVVDGSDNFATRYLSNDVCVWQNKPNVYGSVFRFEGQATVFAPSRGGPCYRCLFPQPPAPGTVPNCAEAGVLGVLPGIIGSIQANEAIKLVLGAGDPLVGRLLHFDALKMKFREFKLRRDPECPVCGEHPTITEPVDYEQFCGIAETDGNLEISVQALKAKLDAAEPILLIDVREPVEHDIARMPHSKLIPLRELSDRIDEVDRTKEIVTFCHKGVRSILAVDLLQDAGFTNVRSLAGGIDAWATTIDPAMARY